MSTDEPNKPEDADALPEEQGGASDHVPADMPADDAAAHIAEEAPAHHEADQGEAEHAIEDAVDPIVDEAPAEASDESLGEGDFSPSTEMNDVDAHDFALIDESLDDPEALLNASGKPLPTADEANAAGFDARTELEKMSAFIDSKTGNIFNEALDANQILYLFDQCPFLQIVNADHSTYGEAQFEVVKGKNGWDIQHYGDAISSSPGLHLFGSRQGHLEKADDEGGGTSDSGLTVGTIIRQAVETAFEMVEMAQERGWGGIMLIDGHPIMQWAAWSKSYDLGYILQGYEPEDADFNRHYRTHLSDIELEELYRKSVAHEATASQ